MIKNKNNIETIAKTYRRPGMWIAISMSMHSIVLILAILLNFFSDEGLPLLIWMLGICIITVCWLGAMYGVKLFISHRQLEFLILYEIIEELRETKQLTKELFMHPLD